MGTVSKALSLLGYFSRTRSLIGLSEMSRLSGLNKATVHRLMGELQEEGFVEQSNTGREYCLGPAFLRLAALREAAVPMREMVRSALESLAKTTGETAHVSLLQGQLLSTLSFAYAHQHGTHVAMEDAEILPLHATSSGLAVLAHSSSKFVDAALAAPLKPRTPQTLTSPQALRAAIAQIRTTGLSESIAGFEADVHTLAMPLFDANQACIGAIAVAAPVSRMTPALKQEISNALTEAAPKLTRQIGGFLPDSFSEAIA